jgi:hypothetical protein
MISVILKTKNLHESTGSHHIVRNQKIFGRLFCFPIGFCSYSLCIAFDGTSFEKKSKFYHFLKLRYMQNKKVFQTFFIAYNMVRNTGFSF